MRRLLTCLLTVALLVGCVFGTAAAAGSDLDRADGIVRAVVLLEGAPLAEDRGNADALTQERTELFAAIEKAGIECRVIYTYDTLVNGFSCDILQRDLEVLSRLPGVKSVQLDEVYGPPEPVELGPTPFMDKSNAITGNDLTIGAGYTGQGMVVAVLDSGVNLTHEAFQVYEGVLGTPKLTQWDEEHPLPDGVDAGRYYSAKIPFGYDYADNDNDPSDEGTETSARGHGSHVSGIAAGYARNEAGEVTFSGAAPGAQLLAMKIYKSDGGGTSTAIYFKALEDALKLGADVVNLSLGVNNGFTYDPVLRDEMGKVFERLEEAGVIVCASAGNSGSMKDNATKGYLDPLYTDYSMVGAPSTYGNNVSVASMDNQAPAAGEGTAQAALATEITGVMSDFSSWGPSPSLTLRPAITSIGGKVYSANWDNSQDAEKYIPQWGTSMSAPNLAGTYATMLSFLAADPDHAGMTKTERAAAVRQLMESTAQTVYPEGAAAPYSVRKQGTGLANSALARKAWASGWLKDPIQEVGDSTEGRFTLRFTVKNNSAAAITYQTSAVLVTDSTEVRTDGHRENTLTAYTLFDNTEAADSLGLVTVTVDETVTVAANSEETMTVTIALTEAGKEYFTDNGFWNGGFVEGYVYLTPTDASPNAATIHATMLGYYGDWAQTPVAEVQDFQNYLAAEYAYHTAADTEDKKVYDFLAQPITTDVNRAYSYSNQDGRLHLVGDNPMNGYTAESFRGEVQYVPYDPSHNVLSANRDNCGYEWLYTQPSLLRNVRFMVMDVKDSEGNLLSPDYKPEPLEPHNNNYVSRASYNKDDHSWHNSSSNMWYLKGNDGDRYHVDIRAILPYGADPTEEPYGIWQNNIWKTLTGYDEVTGEPQYTTGFDITMDSTVPEIVSAVYRAAAQEGEGGTLAVTVKDAHLAGVYLEEEDAVVDYLLFDENAATVNEDGSWTAEFTIPAGLEVTQGQVVAYDYAFNKTAQTAVYEETPAPVDKTALTAAITAADNAKTGVKVIDGKTAAEVDKDVKFVTAAEMKALTDAIAKAQGVADKSDAVQTEVDGAVTELTAAADTFQSAVKTGTYEKVDPPAPPSGGGGGGGGGPAAVPAETTKTETKADGTKVTTVTDNLTGTVTETIQKPDGTREVVETRKDGTVTETVTDSEGAKTEKITAADKAVTITATDKDGKELAKVELPAVIPVPEVKFEDLDAVPWAKAAINNAAGLKLVTGIGGNKYDPISPMTRGSLATVLCRLANGKTAGQAMEFADVDREGWYADGIAWAARVDVVKGIDGNGVTLFWPNDIITREQLAVMLCRYADLLGVSTGADVKTLDRFVDGETTGGWAVDGVAWCVTNGILQGKGENTLDPAAEVTRAEVAVMLDRFITLIR